MDSQQAVLEAPGSKMAFLHGYNNSALGECVALSLRHEIVKPKEWINVNCDLSLPFVCQRERGACFNSSKTSDPPVISSPSNCDETQYLEQNGTIYSPKYPSYYQNSKACYYVVIASPGDLAQIRFDDLQLKQGDAFHIYNALTDSIPFEKITSAIPSTQYIQSTTNVMKVIFVPGSRTSPYGNVEGKSRWKVVFESKTRP
ncbi:CUB domain protein [Oesophagostomum dentatum]|uniref:CUB domain protein n=1 Tax=Oesophagostomum dentatum TaxID=61180 RepID=A0A0B1SVN2_OESDE|nr:CUB domain protein [Oesophagostomum dentatum]